MSDPTTLQIAAGACVLVALAHGLLSAARLREAMKRGSKNRRVRSKRVEMSVHCSMLAGLGLVIGGLVPLVIGDARKTDQYQEYEHNTENDATAAPTQREDAGGDQAEPE